VISTLSALSATAFAATTIDEKTEFLKNHVRPETILRSFHAAEGMWVDCVDIHRQPTLLAPNMAGHVIEAPPPPATGTTSAGTGPTADKIAHLDT
jgi:hypothetical protein